MELTVNLKSRLDEIKRKFPFAFSSVLPAIHAVQEEFGYIPLEIEPAVARYLAVPQERIREVTTFYFMFNNRSVGKYHIYLCSNVSCWLRNYESILAYLEKKLNISAGETTPDGRFTISLVECLGMCEQAPVMQINGISYGDLTPEKIDRILDNLD
ncbi:MAG: NAD(P)H-dependent oxidoreductase subunit E [Acidobacteria bacterium]|nr:NAD(P)H-dependent oxidoreductase subunit E [Acidobacteriota bacterium]